MFNFRILPIVTTQSNQTQTTTSTTKNPSSQASTNGTGPGELIILYQTPQISSPQLIPVRSTDQPQPLPTTKLAVIPVPEPITNTSVKPKPNRRKVKLTERTTTVSEEPVVNSTVAPTTAVSDTTNPSVTVSTPTVPHIFTTAYPINPLFQHLPVLEPVSTRYMIFKYVLTSRIRSISQSVTFCLMFTNKTAVKIKNQDNHVKYKVKN